MKFQNIFFNAHHSPAGAFASFTLGCKGAKGGLGLELGKPADENLYIGVESRDGTSYEALPFYAQAEDDRSRYEVDASGTGPKAFPLHAFADGKIQREFRQGTDTWMAGDLTFRIYSPMPAIPDPGKSAASAVKSAVVPAVWAEMTVDNLFFELRKNPWVVRNVLDLFLTRYAYNDHVREPGSARVHPGGVSFTHDMGTGNVFSRPSYSTYELFGLHGCFSHMTHEQLCNWVLCATTYAAQSGDRAWLKQRLPVLKSCLDSMINRDHYDPARRNGLMSLDSDRCKGGSEITTYDSLDVSLGQSRHNLYMAVKCWASYVAMEAVFRRAKDGVAAGRCGEQAAKCAASICAHQTPEGWIPGTHTGAGAIRWWPVLPRAANTTRAA
jgi:hypothetical protein